MANNVQPSTYRMEDFGSNTPVRAAIPLPAPDVKPSPNAPAYSAFATEGPSSAAKEEPGAANTVPKEQLEARSKSASATSPALDEQPSWWSPGMESTPSSGYDEAYEGQYFYGEQPFYMQ